jgi:hypothetical protein
MTNSLKKSLLFGGVITSFVGILYHVIQMISTNEFFHFVCFFLWMVIGGGLVLWFSHEENKGYV